MESSLEINIKITIMKHDESIHEFDAEADFTTGRIYTEMPVDETSQLIESFYDDDEEVYYGTDLGHIVEKYKGIAISKTE